MIITREKGMRMWGGGSGSTSASGVNGGGGFSLAVEEGEGTGNAYTGFTYESGVLSLIKGEKFVTVDFFNRLFTAYDSDGNAILPNDVTSTINNLKLLVGTWTEEYLSALGKNSEGGGGGGGIELSDVWQSLKTNTDDYANQKINAAHIPDLSGTYATKAWVNQQGFVTSSGVTSVAMTVPTGLSVSGTPITTTGTLALTFATGYSIPTTAKQSNWDTAYGWGNHATAGYATASSVTTLQGYFTNGVAKTAAKLNTGTTTYTAWGQTYWSSGVPQSISGNMTSVGSITPSANGNALGTTSARFNIYGTAGNFSGNVSIGGTLGVTGATTLSSTLSVASGITLTTTKKIYFGDTSHYLELNSTGFHFSHGVYSDSFVSALGANSSGGGGGGVDLDAMWASLMNTITDTYASSKIATAHIPNLAASIITSGTLADARIPSLAASKITSGTFDTARIPNLAASKITSGTFAAARIPIATASAVGGIKVGTTLAISDGVLNQKSGIATAGTYISVTVDTYGRVTAGTNPTTLSGYGITDAYTKTASNGMFMRISDYTDIGATSSSTVSCNSLTTYGVYKNGSTPTASSYVTDRPVTSATPFRLVVERSSYASNPYIRQRYQSYNSNVAYERYSTNTGANWSDWVKVQDNLANYALASSLNKYLPLSGGTMESAAIIRCHRVLTSISSGNAGMWTGSLYTGSLSESDVVITTATPASDKIALMAGYVGIGTYTPAYKLDVDGDVRADNFRGSLIGNATTATKATQDGSGNTITSTYLPLSGGTMSGSIKMNAANKGYYLVDSAGVSYPALFDNGGYLCIGANAASGTHHTGSTYISAGSGEVYIIRLVNNSRATYKNLDTGNTYVSSGKGYLNGSEITTISGNAATATKATQDGDGRTITSTYLTSIGRSGDYITQTKGGTTSNVTNILERTQTIAFKANAVGWYRVAEFISGAGHGNSVLLYLNRVYNHGNNESYIFAITSMHSGKVSICQIAGNYNYQYFTKIRVDNPNSGHGYIDVYYNNSQENESYVTTIGSAYSLSSVTFNPTIVSTVTNEYSISNGMGTSGNFIASGEVTASSDERKKNIISNTKFNVRDIASARSILYEWNDGRDKDNEKKIHGGSIAQDWLGKADSFLNQDSDGWYSINYGALALCSAITIARMTINHEDRITLLEKENAKLKARVAELEERRIA